MCLMARFSPDAPCCTSCTSVTWLTCTPPTKRSGSVRHAASNCCDCASGRRAASGRGAASSRVTEWPASARSLASSEPIRPAPTTAMRCGASPRQARKRAYACKWLMRQHSASGNGGSERACAPCASTRCRYCSVPRLVRSCRLAGTMRTACVCVNNRTPIRAAACRPVSCGSCPGSMPRAMATDSSGLSYTSPLHAVTRVIGRPASRARSASAICQPARPAPTITVPASCREPGRCCVPHDDGRACRTGSSRT